MLSRKFTPKRPELLSLGLLQPLEAVDHVSVSLQ